MIQIEQLPHPDYLKYPSHRTLAFFDDAEHAQNAAEAIIREGWLEGDLHVYEGDYGIDAVDAEGTRHTLKEAWTRWAQKFLGTGEWNLVLEADKELRAGHLLLSVATKNEEEKFTVAELMLLNGGHSIRYVDPLYNEELTPRDPELR
ncbi:hypothetical protein B9G69_006440 [Bdellovibrio sp. SKB1291214]|uniref:hypothetical protein n=1 Tax=Bdellovibrio sp. SKB1291214 TaxID=1732569 RepID=UPI000B518B38|nr:hypothetical protein [Bdellovibrio sp. SKB1291214]UYL10216.1 hypothetical protein B9G69_006440 [Bdellovibrio sp. SKB1291214]